MMRRMIRRLNNLRAYPVAWAILLIGMLALGYVAFSLVVQVQQPFDGVLLTEISGQGVWVATPLLPTPLERGDRLIAIDEQPVTALANAALRGTSPLSPEMRAASAYRMQRGAASVTRLVRWRPFPWQRLILVRFGVYVLAGVSMVVGGYLLLYRPELAATRLIFIAAWSMAVVLLLHFQVAVLLTPWMLIAESVLKLLGYGLLFSAALHLFLIFPVPKAWIMSRERWLWSIHLIDPLVVGGAALLFGATPLEKLNLAWQITRWFNLIMLFGGILSLVHTYATVKQPDVRGQIRWISWGSLLGIVPYMFLTGLPEVLWGYPLVNIELTAFFVVLMPLSIAVAVTRYRLFDVDFVVVEALGHVLLLIGAVGCYIAIQHATTRSIAWITGRAHEVTSVFVATLIAASGFWLARPKFLGYLDLLIYRRRKYSPPGALLDQILDDLTGAIRLEQISALLTETIPSQLGVRHGELLVLNEEATSLALVGGDFSTPLTAAFERWAAKGAPPVHRIIPPDWISDEVLALMEQREIELAVPLRVGQEIVGVLGLGPHVDGRAYTTREVRILRALGRQAALAVQNARLVRRLERQRDNLEDEVRRRIRVMESDRNRLNAILQNMADALLVVDGDGRILVTNPAFERLVRRSSHALIGHRLEKIWHFPELVEVIEKALARPGEVFIKTLPIRDLVLDRLTETSTRQTERMIRLSVTAMPGNDNVICILRDVTQEVEVDQMKSKFISTVSHELRTPLTSILGFAKLTHRTFVRSIAPLISEDELAHRAVERIDHNLEIMVSEGDRLTTLINDVLDIASLDAGTIRWHDQPYEISLLIHRVVEELSATAEKKGLPVRIEVERDLPALAGDPRRIQQVMWNLLSNAIKFTASGQITISARSLAAESLIYKWRVPQGGGVLVSVADTGMGISEEEKGQLFQRFQQGGDALRNKPKGTGLGLAICREIVNHYQGEIWAESEPGAGTTFFFTLPVSLDGDASPEMEAKIFLPPYADALSAPLILIAENDPQVRHHLAEHLAAEGGYRVLTVATGSEVGEQARQQCPAAIILAIRLPRLSGVEVLRLLKSDLATVSVPVVMIAATDHRATCMRLGASAYLFKPVAADTLRETLEQLL